MTTTDGGALRAARTSLGWSQGRAAAELAALATRHGVAVASPASLKTQLSRWENQHVTPEDTYRVLLCELYGRTDVELGLTATAAADRIDDAELLRAELAVAAAVDDAAVQLLAAQLSATSALDSSLGTAAVADSLYAQLVHLERVLAHTVSRHTRRGLAQLVGSAAMLAGRVEDDAGLPAGAWRHFERAGQVGHEIRDSLLTCWAMVEQARILVDVGQASAALELLDVAEELATSGASAVPRAWLAARRADALAAAGADAQARSAYRLAERELADGPLRIDLGYPAATVLEFDHAALHQHRGHGLHMLRDEEAAIAELERALSAGPGSTRDVAAVHVDLAHAFSASDDRAAADAHARTARELASRIGSVRLRTKLDARPWTQDHR